MLNGKIKYSGTEKIEKKIYDELEEKFEARFNAMADEIRRSVIAEIREELRPETVPYDRLRLIEQRMHEMSITQDGIVREIVDIKTTSNTPSADVEKKPIYETAALTNQSAQNIYDILAAEQPVPAERPRHPQAEPDYDYMQQTQAMSETRRVMPPPGFNQQSGAASRRVDGWEFQEFVPPKKNNAEPEKFIPAKTIPARDDPFYFADAQEEVLDVSSLREPEAPKPSFEKQPAFENVPLTIQKIKVEEKETPDRAEYIIGSNKKQTRVEKEEDYNAGCEYIIAEKDTGGRKFGGRRGGKPASELKEKVISSDEDDTEIITYE